MSDSSAPVDAVETWRTLLATAKDLVERVADDPARALAADLRPDPGRRSPRPGGDPRAEVGLRTATQDEGEVVMGYGLRPNPNARLDFRVVEKTPDAVPFFDRDQMVHATLRGVQIMRLLVTPAFFAEWRAATRQAYEQLDAEERAVVRRVVEEVLAALAAADSGSQSTG
jgi:hypothetical protein